MSGIIHFAITGPNDMPFPVCGFLNRAALRFTDRVGLCECEACLVRLYDAGVLAALPFSLQRKQKGKRATLRAEVTDSGELDESMACGLPQALKPLGRAIDAELEQWACADHDSA